MAATQLTAIPICEAALIRPAESRKLDREMCTLIQQVRPNYVMPDYCIAAGFATRTDAEIASQAEAARIANEAARDALAASAAAAASAGTGASSSSSIVCDPTAADGTPEKLACDAGGPGPSPGLPTPVGTGVCLAITSGGADITLNSDLTPGQIATLAGGINQHLDEDDDANTGAIVAVVIGAVLLFVLVGTLIYKCTMKGRSDGGSSGKTKGGNGVLVASFSFSSERRPSGQGSQAKLDDIM